MAWRKRVYLPVVWFIADDDVILAGQLCTKPETLVSVLLHVCIAYWFVVIFKSRLTRTLYGV